MSGNDRVLVTGGNGFLGAWIVRALLETGTQVAILDLDGDDHILRQVVPGGVDDSIARFVGDIADSRCVQEAVGEFAPTSVIHLAGLQVPACQSDPVRGARVNVLGALNVFEAAALHRGTVRNVVYASSAAVAGPPEDYQGPVPDEAHHVPRTHYGVFKLANEGAARVYWNDRGVPSAGLRPLTVYGVGREQGLTSGPTKAIKAALLGRPYRISFSGKTGFHYVEDVAAAFVAASRAALTGATVLNLRGHVLDAVEFVAALEQVCPEATGRITVSGSPLPIAYDVLQDGLERIVGALPLTPAVEGIRKTLERFRSLHEAGKLPERDLDS